MARCQVSQNHTQELCTQLQDLITEKQKVEQTIEEVEHHITAVKTEIDQSDKKKCSRS